MSRLLVYNIATLAGITRVPGLARKCGADMAEFDCIHDAYLLVDDGRIADFGLERDLSVSAHEVVDARRGTVLPSFCDSHTHLVYAGSREQEFVDKINGLSYAEIARRGGGILNSADRLHHMSADELYAQAMQRIDEVVAKGTGCIEIKSGYGLNTADELKMLRVVKRIKRDAPLKVVSTFLGAHAVGRDYAGRQSAYVDLVVDEMIPAVAAADALGRVQHVGIDEKTLPLSQRVVLAARRDGGLAGLDVHRLQLVVPVPGHALPLQIVVVEGDWEQGRPVARELHTLAVGEDQRIRDR